MSVQTARGKQIAVVSGHHLATDAALDVLRSGGNVVDAAIAGAVLLAVALPHACGLGGDCFILLHWDGETYAVNGSGPAPALLPRGLDKATLSTGPLSSTVPGVVGAWDSLHERFGSLPWADLLSPAIGLAKDGVTPASDYIKALAANREALEHDPGCRALFLSNKCMNGQLLVQSALAESLALIAADRSAAFYTGEIGRKLCAASQACGGVMSMDDLGVYAPLWTKPLSYHYHGYDVHVCPPNSYGLLMLLQLAALSGANLAEHPIDSAGRLRLLMAATRAAIVHGETLLADPTRIADRSPEALSPAAIASLQDSVRSTKIKGKALPPANGTAVISVADANGNGVTIVQSIFVPFGALVADAETGIVFNNRLLGFSTDPNHPNFAEPRKRPAHTLSPAPALQNGRLCMLLGTPGGTGQTITLSQVFTNMVDYGLDLTSAIALPRWALDINGNLVVEPEIPAENVAVLNANGFEVRVSDVQQRFFFGSAECIDLRGGELVAVADNRRNATARAY